MGKYQPYPEYREGTGELLARMPAHWMTGQVKYAHSVVLGKMLQSDAKSPADKLLPYLRAANVAWGGVNLTDVREMWFSPMERKALKLEPGDVVISEGGDVGRSAVWLGELPECYFQNAINRARPKGENSSRYLYYWMSFIKNAGYIDIICNKSTIPHYTAEKVQGTPFAFPPASEQSDISAFLDHETAKIDRLIAKQVRLIELLKEKRQAVISHAVTKGLNPDVPMKDSGVEWLGEVPAHWVVAGFKKFLESVVDYRGKTPEKIDDGVLLVTARNIGNGKIDYTASQEFISPDQYEEVMRRGMPRIGDVLFVTEAPLGEVACVDREDIALAQRVIKFRGKAGLLDNYFLKYFIMSASFQSSLTKYATGSTALGIKAERLVYLRQLVPPLHEQQAIVEYVDVQLSRFDLLTQKARAAIELMREHRTALISAAVTGKIDVRGWQKPNNKPQEAATAASA